MWNKVLNKGSCWERPRAEAEALALMEEPHVGRKARSQEPPSAAVSIDGSPRVRTEPREQLPRVLLHSIVDFRCFCFSMFSLFSCLLACLLDFLLSRVADEAFYKQPFADVIGYVYVAKLIPFLLILFV